MAKKAAKKGKTKPIPEPQPKDFLDMIAPAAVRFNTDHYILGGACHCALALRSYPTSTEELALLRGLGERSGTSDMKQTVTAEANLQDVASLVSAMHRNREPLIHCAVYLDLAAKDLESLRSLREEVMGELVRSKLGVDRILLRQQDGFLSVNPAGRNALGTEFERVLPASSVANLFPFNYSGKTDPPGVLCGPGQVRQQYHCGPGPEGGRQDQRQHPHSGQLGAGEILPPEAAPLQSAGVRQIRDLLRSRARAGGAVRQSGRLFRGPDERAVPHQSPGAQGVGRGGPGRPGGPRGVPEALPAQPAYLVPADFFRSYKEFSDRHVDAIELMLERLYEKWGIHDGTDFSRMHPVDFPVLSDLYAMIEDAYQNYVREENPLFPRELLQEVLLGLHSMCRGAESRFFNGYTNITSARFLVFGVKGLLQASGNVKNALLFNVLSFLSDKLLTEGNTAASIDELYLFLSNPTTIEYIRNFMKRVRKKDSSVLLASQNIEDFALPGVAELTKLLFSIPTHQFLFNAGSIDRRFFMDNLQLEESEYELIRYPQRGVCLYKCGNERYLLEVHAPPYKEKLFGKAGGR